MSDTSVVPLRTGAKITGIIPTNIEEVFRLATAISKSGMAPRGMDKPEQLTVAILHGLEIGLPPMMSINKIAVVNGRPTLWGDAVPALLWAKGFKLREWADDTTAYCEVTRPDQTKIERSFSEVDARKAGLWGKAGPWTQYPGRMLQMRARGLASRDGAADALSGLYLAEEMQDAPPIDLTPRKTSAAAKRDGTNETFNEIVAAVQHAPTLEVLEQIPALYADEVGTLPQRWHDLYEGEYETRLLQLGGTRQAAE